MIRFEHVSKSYGDNLILKDLSFEVQEGEFAVLIGSSGCGKTTTLRTINRLIEPNSGKVFVKGEDISKIDPVKLRRSIGYVIQQIGLFPNMTVAQNISVVPKLLKYDKKEIDRIVHEMLEMVGMPYNEYAHKYTREMSGGQQQRIGVLRALAASPPVVLMDEPFSALDPITRASLQEEVRQLQKKLNKTIVFVTHDMDEALNMADRVIFMDKGEIVQMAPPTEMLANPANDLVRNFLGKRSIDEQSTPQTAADFLRTNISTTYVDARLRESVELMARRNVDTLIAKNRDETYAGIVTVEDIERLEKGSGIKTVEPLLRHSNPVSYIDEDAQVCFDKLLDGNADYVVVIRADNTIAGIVTRTSIAKALADAVWGDAE